MPRSWRSKIMKRSSKITLWSLCGFAILVILAVASSVVWQVHLIRAINTKERVIHSVGLPANIKELNENSDVSAKLEAIRAAGLPTSGAKLNAYYPAVPDNENAALVMTQAFALMQDFSDNRSSQIANFQIPPSGQPLTAGQKQLLASYVGMNSEVLTKMREAIKLPGSRYPIDYLPGFATLLPHLGKLKNLARIAEYDALLTVGPGHSQYASQSIADILGMAKTLENEPLLVSELVRVAMIANATQILEYSLNMTSFGEAELLNLGKDFADAEKTNLMARAMIGERAMNIPILLSPLNWHEMKLMFEQIPTNSPLWKPSWSEIIKADASGIRQGDLRFYLGAMETNIALAGLTPPDSLAATNVFEAEGKEAKEQHYPVSAFILPPMSGVFIREARSFVNIHLAITAFAVERFRLANGKLPENLNELTPQFLSAVPADPFDGKPLRYHRLAKGYAVYSVGQDGHDDGGREKPANWNSADETTYDITFTVER
jgi:hypothetical protein